MPILTEYNPFDHLLTEDELSQYLTDAYEDDTLRCLLWHWDMPSSTRG